jgi:hypothetical protein
MTRRALMESRDRERERICMKPLGMYVAAAITRTMDFLFELQQRDYDMKKSKL